MALVQYLRIEEYYNFFAKKLKAGETVILDNGAYEGNQIGGALLAKWTNQLRPSVVVLPDKPGDFVQTIHNSINFLNCFFLPSHTEAMTVLHAPDGDLKAFEVAYANVQTGWVGFSRLTKRYAWGTSTRREFFAHHLQDTKQWRPELVHHALGMLDGEVKELPGLTKAGFHSCDSSAPIWRGLHGYSLTDKWLKYEFQPNASDEVCNWTQAEANLTEVLKACDQD